MVARVVRPSVSAADRRSISTAREQCVVVAMSKMLSHMKFRELQDYAKANGVDAKQVNMAIDRQEIMDLIDCGSPCSPAAADSNNDLAVMHMLMNMGDECTPRAAATKAGDFDIDSPICSPRPPTRDDSMSPSSPSSPSSPLSPGSGTEWQTGFNIDDANKAAAARRQRKKDLTAENAKRRAEAAQQIAQQQEYEQRRATEKEIEEQAAENAKRRAEAVQQIAQQQEDDERRATEKATEELSGLHEVAVKATQARLDREFERQQHDREEADRAEREGGSPGASTFRMDTESFNQMQHQLLSMQSQMNQIASEKRELVVLLENECTKTDRLREENRILRDTLDPTDNRLSAVECCKMIDAHNKTSEECERLKAQCSSLNSEMQTISCEVSVTWVTMQEKTADCERLKKDLDAADASNVALSTKCELYKRELVEMSQEYQRELEREPCRTPPKHVEQDDGAGILLYDRNKMEWRQSPMRALQAKLLKTTCTECDRLEASLRALTETHDASVARSHTLAVELGKQSAETEKFKAQLGSLGVEIVETIESPRFRSNSRQSSDDGASRGIRALSLTELREFDLKSP